MKGCIWLETEAEITMSMRTTNLPYLRVQTSRVYMPRFLTYLPTMYKLASRFHVSLVFSVILGSTNFVAEDVLDLS